MKYEIEYDYRTGNSFHSEDRYRETLEGEYSSLELVKRNLNRIKEHYEYFLKIRKSHFNIRRDVDRNLTQKDIEKWRENLVKTASEKDWFVEKYEFCLKLEADNGNMCEISAPWCGYFETLYAVRVKIKPAEPLEYRFN